MSQVKAGILLTDTQLIFLLPIKERISHIEEKSPGFLHRSQGMRKLVLNVTVEACKNVFQPAGKHQKLLQP